MTLDGAEQALGKPSTGSSPEHAPPLSLSEKLDWLRKNQPRNIAAINALERKMGLPLTPAPPKKEKSVIDGHQLAKENKWLRGLRTFLPGHEPR